MVGVVVGVVVVVMVVVVLAVALSCTDCEIWAEVEHLYSSSVLSRFFRVQSVSVSS